MQQTIKCATSPDRIIGVIETTPKEIQLSNMKNN